MLDPADCGPAFLALPQDVQAEAFDFPDEFFATDGPPHRPAACRPRPVGRAAAVLQTAKRPLIIAGGGVHYSLAEAALAAFAEAHNIPVVETVAGRTSLPATHPLNAGPVGVTGCAAPTNWPATPTWCWRSAPVCRTSPPGRGRCSPATAS